MCVCVFCDVCFWLSAIAKKKHSKIKQFRAFSILKRNVINNLIIEQACLSIQGKSSIRFHSISNHNHKGHTIKSKNQLMQHKLKVFLKDPKVKIKLFIAIKTKLTK